MLTPSSLSFPIWHRALLHVIRFSFWFACFWAVVGVTWRPPLASVGLMGIFLALLVAVEWVTRRLTSKKTPTVDIAEPMDETVRQQIIRSRTAEGLDRLDGTFWAEFSADAMTTTVHIPFCPPFERVPRVQVFPMNETSAHLRIAAPKTYGVRIDVRRNDGEPDQLCFGFVVEEAMP